MFMYLSVLLIVFFFPFLFFFSKFWNLLSKEKLSPFECGFDPFSQSRLPFSLKFFFIGIVFLIFDVEIIIILPFPILLQSKSLSIIFSFILINLVIMFGLIYEWNLGMIDWLK
uniref:NADH-ubiquinone oxidoreductase chain 3 n=2 Tax=Bothriocroton concolor TaxID=65640 RepID=H9M728_BOTCN|nr:NADH dehydrogenase subunit 3 [Bothriocroton concolor]AET63045.1 NADH dehydrogenase subunit 3 [Bothriocroton concolor]